MAPGGSSATSTTPIFRPASSVDALRMLVTSATGLDGLCTMPVKAPVKRVAWSQTSQGRSLTVPALLRRVRQEVLRSARIVRIVMSIRSLSGFLAIVVTAACASFYRVPIPNWERYQQGELAGFVHAPGEHVVHQVPGITVRRARGRVVSSAEDSGNRPVNQVRPSPAVRVQEEGGGENVDLGAIDVATVFVVEVRGPGSSRQVRTVATRNFWFDFGPLPNGTYTFKATVLGWPSTISTIRVSDSADAAARLSIVLW